MSGLSFSERMVRGLNIDVEIITGPIIREPDGLAMSSRNQYLDEEERKQATVLYRSLKLAGELVAGGETSARAIEKKVRELIVTASRAVIDYVSVAVAEMLTPLEKIEERAVIALAVRFGKTRLIDNTILERNIQDT